MPIPLRTPSDHVVDLVDESFVRARPTVLRAVLEDPRLDALVWPGHEVSVTRDRGHKGRHYAVAGRITGVAEVWLEPFDDGTIVHHYVRGTTRALTARSARAAVAAHRRRFKIVLNAVKDALEADTLSSWTNAPAPASSSPPIPGPSST